MESHEEKLLAMVQESKMNQAREIMKQKERELKASQPSQSGLSYFASFLSSALGSVTSSVRGADSSAASHASSMSGMGSTMPSMGSNTPSMGGMNSAMPSTMASECV